MRRLGLSALLALAHGATHDLIVYGGTPAGVAAAVGAARSGVASVAVVQPWPHRIGGMCSGGLGASDVGNTSVIGGFALEFFQANGRRYNEAVQWHLEPHVALDLFTSALSAANVQVYYDSDVVSVSRTGTRITGFTTGNATYEAAMFIDASYEGDLLARAGASFAVGREAATQYNESLAGNRGGSSGHQFAVRVDPLDSNGRPLPLLTPAPTGAVGEADKKVQAYNFRLCVTKNKQNQVPFPQPADYDPATWELARRWFRAQSSPPAEPSCNIQVVPNNKADMNNCGPVSTDAIGLSWAYPEADYATRRTIWDQHRSYTQGLLWFLGHDPDVPEAARNATLAWGLCKDEFTDSDNWPQQLYVREARRLVGDSVFTQGDVERQRGHDIGALSIGMGSYNYDSHNAQRYACVDPKVCTKWPTPYVWNEGDVEVSPKYHYQIPLTVLFPKRAELTNLLSPTCGSASHVAFATLRMEPQFMIMGQSAGVVAATALQQQVAVQDVDRQTVAARLLAANQILRQP